MGADKGPVAQQPKLAAQTDKGEVYTLSQALSTMDAGSGSGATPSPSEAPPAPAVEAGPKEEDLNDPADAEIAVGTKCKRRACGKEYTGPDSREEECSVGFLDSRACYGMPKKLDFLTWNVFLLSCYQLYCLQFHPGVAVFHEGSKGYSCCTRKVLEFDQFLKLTGCKKGRHRFTDVAGVGLACS